MDLTGEFERERPRLTRIAARVLGDPAEAEDAVQQAWLRLARGDAAAALPVFVHGRPGAAWFDRGVARVAFDFRVSGGLVTRIDFRARPEALETINRRRDGDLR
ncbi:sigma factor [Dietzia cercidiphylli]|uniref:sigma factor n=1 Tax=Dietzia cercidiphylli TaxID=498199 RepID=UPI0035CCFC72